MHGNSEAENTQNTEYESFLERFSDAIETKISEK